MRIAIATPVIGDAFGQERVVRESVRLLREVGHEVYFLGEAQMGAIPECEGFEIVPEISSLQILSNPKLVYNLNGKAAAFLERVKPDVIHLVDQFNPLLMNWMTSRFKTVLSAHTVAPTCPASTRLIAGNALCSKKSGWKCLLHNKTYGCLDFLKSDLHRLHAIQHYQWKRRALRKMHKIAAISRYVRAQLIYDGFPESQVTVVYNPVPIPQSVVKLDEVPKNMLVSASRLVPLKGLDLLMQALKRIENLEWTLCICGEGPEEARLRSLAAQLKITSRIRFLGTTSYAETQKIIASARALVQPNVGPEAFGMSVAEASALGVPSVAFDVPALNEIITHEQNGLLAEPASPPALADELRRILTDEALCAALRKNGPRLMAERFSPTNHLRQTLSLYGVESREMSQHPELHSLRG